MVTIEQAREMRQGVTLTGDRNQCGECGELFNSTYPFELHRTGTVGVHDGPDARRCMTIAEMRMLGMVKNAAGFWVSRLMTSEDVTRVEASQSEIDSAPSARSNTQASGTAQVLG